MAGDTPTVLVVEDEPPLVEIYARWLETEYEVRTAGDGSDALDTLDEQVDVVLLDRLMPGMSGDEVLPHIRERAPDCKVAMVTAVKPDFDVLGMGFDDYITKPVERDQLLETVEQLLAREEFDEMTRELYALASKRSALHASKNEAELRNSEQYRELEADIEDLREELAEETVEIDDSEFVSMVRELDGESGDGGNGTGPDGESGGGGA
jgi:DNA-binding response OmpR family regulator